MSKISVGVLGTGGVGRTLAAGLARKGYSVVLGTRDAGKAKELAEFLKANAAVKLVSQEEAVRASQVVVLAVPGAAALDVVKALRGALESGEKIVLDACNPISGGPKDGVFPFFTPANGSLMEALQEAAPGARFVKAFNSVGEALMVDPTPTLASKPTMFICGNDADAKRVVSELVVALGWEPDDVGLAGCAGPIEALCKLYCARSMNHGWEPVAFKLVKKA